MQTFCTIVTTDFLPFAKVLFRSLKSTNKNCQLQVLVLDDVNEPGIEGLNIHSIYSLKNYSLFNDLEKKYAHTQTDKFRWSLKPIFISFLLENNFDKVIYLDPDICFFNDCQFLFGELNDASVLLTPHWRDKNPLKNEENFRATYKDGLYNGGFIGATKKGLPALKWWAELCHYKMDRQNLLGIYDDQRYLDSMPVYFQDIKILKHKGCNIAVWNIHECKREKINNEVLINGQYPLIFIHFTNETIQNILNNNDPLLKPYLEKYLSEIKKEGIDLSTHFQQQSKYKNSVYKAKHKLRIRTRLKRFLFLLAEKL